MTISERIDAYEAALASYARVATWVDANQCAGLPSTLKGHIRLDLSLGAVDPVDDLVVDESGISCTLSFSKIKHHVFMPWPAILGFQDSNQATKKSYEHYQKTGVMDAGIAFQPESRVISRDRNLIRVRFGV